VAAALDRVAQQEIDTFHLADAAREAELHGAVAAATQGADVGPEHSAVEMRPGLAGDAGNTEFVIIVAIVVFFTLVAFLAFVVFPVLLMFIALVALCHRRERLCHMRLLVLVAFLTLIPFFVLVPFLMPVIVCAFRVLMALTMFCTLTVFLAVAVWFALGVLFALVMLFALARELDDLASRLGPMRTWTAFDFRAAAVVVFAIGVEKNRDLGDPQVFPSRNEGEHPSVKPEPEAPGTLFAVGAVFVSGRIQEQLPGVSEVTAHVKEAPAIAG
jgi:hypothetical protein